MCTRYTAPGDKPVNGTEFPPAAGDWVPTWLVPLNSVKLASGIAAPAAFTVEIVSPPNLLSTNALAALMSHGTPRKHLNVICAVT